MIEHFPYEFTLASGTRVVVNKLNNTTYDFSLTPSEGPAEHFTYIEDGRTKSDWDEALEFEQLDALRTFWLENEDVV